MTNQGDERLGVSDIAPLLHCLEDDDPGVRAAALAALVRLPLDWDARTAVAMVSLDVLRVHEPSPLFFTPLARVMATQVRERIYELLATAPDPIRSAIAHALAAVGDHAGASILLTELDSDDAAIRLRAAESAACCGFGVARTASRAWKAVKNDGLSEIRLLVATGITRTGDLGPFKKVLGEIKPAGRGLEIRYAYGDASNTPLVSLPPLPAKTLAVVEKKLEQDQVPFLERMLESQTQTVDRPIPHAAPGSGDVAIDRETAVTPKRRARAREVAKRLQGVLGRRDPDSVDPETLQRIVTDFQEAANDLAPDDASRFLGAAFSAIVPRDWQFGNLIVQTFGTARDLRPDIHVMMATHARCPSGSTGQQSAWFASRTPLAEVIAALAEILSTGDPSRRIEAAAFVEDVATYAAHDYGPLFGETPAATYVPTAEMIDLPVQTAKPERLVRKAVKKKAARPEPAAIDPQSNMQAPPESVPGDEAGKVYARLDCDSYVVAGREFELIVGIANLPSAGVVGLDLEGLRGRCNYLLNVRVIADGFSLRVGESWRLTLAVTESQRYPAYSLHLTADLPATRLEPRAIQATYSVDGQITGTASRAVNVAIDETAIPTEREPSAQRGTDIAIPLGPDPPDLTVVLCKGRIVGRLLLSMVTPHATIPLPDEDLPVVVGEEPAAYARKLIDTMNAREGRKSLYQDLCGFGYRLARALPREFWAALQAVRDTVGPEATLMLLSDDPYIPWELALLEKPCDAAAAPFLAAQFSVGRWLLHSARLPAPHELAVRSIAAVAGTYSNSRWTNLEQAIAEQDDLANTWKAERVDATYGAVSAALARDPGLSIIHVALHGNYDPTGTADGLALIDDEWISPENVLGGPRLCGSPFVFLNACQVGAANQVLGQYAGMAAAFLEKGAGAVVAPLWKIKDGIARDIAKGFYSDTFTKNITVGEAIRRRRAAFRDTDEAGQSSTYVAYQYFGHPGLRLRKE